MIDWLLNVQRAVFQPYSGRKQVYKQKNQKESPGMGQHGQRLLTAMLGMIGQFSWGKVPMAFS